MLKSFFYFLALLISIPVLSQDKNLYEKKNFILNNDTLPYRILIPLNYSPQKKYPLIVFLHGSGERGNDDTAQLKIGASYFLQDSIRAKYPAFVLYPQCATNDFWAKVKFTLTKENNNKYNFEFVNDNPPSKSLSLVLSLMDTLIKENKIDTHNIIAMGLSMGGMGVYEIVYHRPKLFSRAVVMCGGANPKIAPSLIQPKWWIFHGAKDDIVKPECDIQMYDALKKYHANVKLTLFPNDNHNCWDNTFATKELIGWMFEK